jgi:hypothetical protein
MERKLAKVAVLLVFCSPSELYLIKNIFTKGLKILIILGT